MRFKLQIAMLAAVIACVTAIENKKSIKELGEKIRDSRNLEYSLNLPHSRVASFRSLERRISSGPQEIPIRNYAANYQSRQGYATIKRSRPSFPAPPYAVQMEPMVQYSQKDPLYDINGENLEERISKNEIQAQAKILNVGPDQSIEQSHHSENIYAPEFGVSALQAGPPYSQVSLPYYEHPEPIIEIIIKESNESLPAPPLPPQAGPRPKEPVQVFYVKYQRNPHGDGKDVIYDAPIPAITPATNDEDYHHSVEYTTISPETLTLPPPPSTTLRAIIRPESEDYHSDSGVKITFGTEHSSHNHYDLHSPEGHEESAPRVALAHPQDPPKQNIQHLPQFQKRQHQQLPVREAQQFNSNKGQVNLNQFAQQRIQFQSGPGQDFNQQLPLPSPPNQQFRSPQTSFARQPTAPVFSGPPSIVSQGPPRGPPPPSSINAIPQSPSARPPPNFNQGPPIQRPVSRPPPPNFVQRPNFPPPQRPGPPQRPFHQGPQPQQFFNEAEYLQQNYHTITSEQLENYREPQILPSKPPTNFREPGRNPIQAPVPISQEEYNQRYYEQVRILQQREKNRPPGPPPTNIPQQGSPSRFPPSPPSFPPSPPNFSPPQFAQNQSPAAPNFHQQQIPQQQFNVQPQNFRQQLPLNQPPPQFQQIPNNNHHQQHHQPQAPQVPQNNQFQQQQQQHKPQPPQFSPPQQHSQQQHSPQQHGSQQHGPQQQHSPQQHGPQQHSPQQHSPQQHNPQQHGSQQVGPKQHFQQNIQHQQQAVNSQIQQLPQLIVPDIVPGGELIPSISKYEQHLIYNPNIQQNSLQSTQQSQQIQQTLPHNHKPEFIQPEIHNQIQNQFSTTFAPNDFISAYENNQKEIYELQAKLRKNEEEQQKLLAFAQKNSPKQVNIHNDQYFTLKNQQQSGNIQGESKPSIVLPEPRNPQNYISHSTNKPPLISVVTPSTPKKAYSTTIKTTTQKPEKTTKKNIQFELPDEVPDDLRQQLLASGILENAQISVLDYDKVGDIPLESLPPEQLANFYGAGGGLQIAGSAPISAVVSPNGEQVINVQQDDSVVEDDQEVAGSARVEKIVDINGKKKNVEMKVVHFDPNTAKGQQLADEYLQKDAKTVDPVTLNDQKYNRYLPLKVSGAQFPLPEVPELKGRKVTSVVVLAPVNYEFKKTEKDGGRSERAAPSKTKGVNFVAGDALKRLVKTPTMENYIKWLEKENSTSPDLQSVVLLVTGSEENEEAEKEIFMYDISTQTVSKLNGELSNTFVEVAETNANNNDFDHVALADTGVVESSVKVMAESTTIAPVVVVTTKKPEEPSENKHESSKVSYAGIEIKKPLISEKKPSRETEYGSKVSQQVPIYQRPQEKESRSDSGHHVLITSGYSRMKMGRSLDLEE